MKFINVRGCNGSGKTTLLRLLASSPSWVDSVTVTHEVRKKDKHTGKRVSLGIQDCVIPVTYCPGGKESSQYVAILGDYTPETAGAVTAGCDRIKTQEAIKNALETLSKNPDIRFILFEGIVVSTIYGPWKEWAERNGGMVWAFLDTPLDICLDRIQARNGGKPVKEDQIAYKHKTIRRVKEKAFADHQTVLNLHYTKPLEDLLDYMFKMPPFNLKEVI